MALSKIDVANMLTGATPVANGGTGLASGTSGQFLKFTGSTTLASAADNAGKIAQVQSTTLATEQSSTSDSFIDTSLTVNITPSSSSNKVLVMVAHGMGYTASGTESRFKLVRDTTDIDEYIVNLGLSGSGGGSAINYLDTPNTTSQITYKVQMRRNSGSGAFYMCANDTVSTITAMEISA
jgi:hypothetical protein